MTDMETVQLFKEVKYSIKELTTQILKLTISIEKLQQETTKEP
jgi:hypothetical protein